MEWIKINEEQDNPRYRIPVWVAYAKDPSKPFCGNVLYNAAHWEYDRGWKIQWWNDAELRARKMSRPTHYMEIPQPPLAEDEGTELR